MGKIVQLDRKQQLIILLLAGLILFGGGYRYAQVKERTALEELPRVESQAPVQAKEIQVHVMGAVAKPGVYKLQQGDRVIDAINLAVLLEDAEPDALRLASILSDGQTITVPYRLTDEELAGLPGSAGSRPTVISANDGLININTADINQLTTLPGIGPALAERIVSYRETNGLFNSVEEIRKVSGIGEKRFLDIRDRITV